jgi:hypothetical protein
VKWTWQHIVSAIGLMTLFSASHDFVLLRSRLLMFLGGYAFLKWFEITAYKQGKNAQRSVRDNQENSSK